MPELTLQPAAAAGLDTYIRADEPTTNYATDTTILTGSREDGSPDTWHILIKFDLTAIALGSKIQEAKLTLELTSQSTTATIGQAIHRILPENSGWTESGATWNTQDGSDAWEGSAGCSTAGSDYEAQAMGTFSVVDIAVQTTYVVTLDPTIFQRLIDIGNYGLFIRQTSGNPGTTRSKRFASSDHGTAGFRPELFIRWLEPSGELIKYRFNIYDALKRIRDNMGTILQPDEVRPNNWIKVEGFELPGSEVHSSLVKDPEVSYIVGTDYDEDAQGVQIKTDRNQFAELIIRRIAGGG